MVSPSGMSMRIEGFKGRLRLRFTYQGIRKCLSLGLPDTATNRLRAEQVALLIRSDIERGCFDFSLDKYREKKDQIKPASTTFESIAKEWLKANKNGLDNRTLQWYEGALKRVNHLELKTLIYSDILTALNGLSNTTAKRYLTIYKTCWSWGLQHRLFDRVDDPFKGVFISKKKQSTRIEPFNSKEIKLIINGFDEFYPEYKSIIVFMLETGCRTSEALGLMWKDFSKELTSVTINRQLTRGELKPPKNGKIRRYKLSLSTTALLTVLPKNKPFVFHGGDWDDRSIYTRWKKVLTEKNIKYRKPYNTRHTFVSHCLESGANVFQIAQVTGHDPNVLLSNYAGVISEPEAPSIHY